MESIYLKRGQNLNIIATFYDVDGTAIVLDETWTVSSAMKPRGSCSDTISLSPTIVDGNVSIIRSTDDLSAPAYEIDIIANDGSDREISETFALILSNTVTPL